MELNKDLEELFCLAIEDKAAEISDLMNQCSFCEKSLSEALVLVAKRIRGGEKSAKVLIEAGASLDHIGFAGKNAKTFAQDRTSQKFNKFICTYTGDTPKSEGTELEKLFSRAAQQSDNKLLHECLQKGVNLNTLDRNKETALILTAHRLNIKGVRLLLAAGADVNYHEGYLSALDHVLPSGKDQYAAKPGKLELFEWFKFFRIPAKRRKIAKLLVKNGGRVSNREMKTPPLEAINHSVGKSRGDLEAFIRNIIFTVIPTRRAANMAARKATQS